MTITEQIQTNKAKFDSAVQEILSNQDLNEQARRRMVRDVYEQSRGEHVRLVEEERAQAEERLKAARLAAFAPPQITIA